MKTGKIKIIFTLFFFIYIFVIIDFKNLLEILVLFDFRIYFFVILLFLSGVLVSSLRWKILLSAYKIDVNIGKLFKYYLFGYILNFTLPSNIGGDGYKIYKLIKSSQDRAGAATATVMDRVLGLLALITLTSLFLPFNNFFSRESRLLLGLFFLFTLIIFVSFLFGCWDLPEKIKKKIKKNKLLFSVYRALIVYRSNKKIILFGFLLSLVFHLLGVLNQKLSFGAIGINLEFYQLLMVIPITRLITALPISIGGMGLQEMTLIKILSSIGIIPAQVLAYSLVGYSLSIFVLFLYLLLFFFNRLKKFFYRP